jgi:hypothetical protein
VNLPYYCAQNHSERQGDSDSFFDLVPWPMPQVFKFCFGTTNELQCASPPSEPDHPLALEDHVWHEAETSADPERDRLRQVRANRAQALEERRRQERQQVAHERAAAARFQGVV